MLFNDLNLYREERTDWNQKEALSGNETDQLDSGSGIPEVYTQEEVNEMLREQESEWQEKMQEMKHEVEQEARQEGIAEGKKLMKTEMESRLETLEESIKKAGESFQNIIDELKPYMASMVFDLAEKVLNQSLKDKKLHKSVEADIDEILKELENETRATITVSAEDLDHIDRFVEKKRSGEPITVKASDSLKTGEYTIDTCSERIVKNFRKILKDFREKVSLTSETEDGGA